MTTINVVVNPPAQVNVSAPEVVGSQVSASTVQYSATVQTNGLQGPQGAQGPQGIQGVQGPQGIQGAAGPGLQVIDTLSSVGELPSTGAAGDAYLINGDLYVWGQRDIRHIGSTAAFGDSVNIPTGHRSGDLLIAFTVGLTTFPTNISGWTSRRIAGSGDVSCRVATKFAQSGSEPSVTAFGAGAIAVSCFRGVSFQDPVDADSSFLLQTVASGNAGNVRYPGRTTNLSGSWFVAFAAHRSLDTALQIPPFGMTNRSSALGGSFHVVSHDTNSNIASFQTTDVAVGGTDASRIVGVVEIKRAATGWYNAGRVLA